MSYFADSGYSVTSADNTTVVPLLAGASFIGAGELNRHPCVFVDVRTDSDCVVYFEYSTDNLTWFSYPESGYELNSANGYKLLKSGTKAGAYFRLHIDNGATDQTILFATTYYGSFSGDSSPLDTPIAPSDSSPAIRSRPPWFDLASGGFSGITTVRKFGRNDSVGTSFVPVSIGGIYNTPQFGSATAVRVAAGDVNDTAAGTGAQSIKVIGLDSSGAEAEEVISTSGTSASSPTTVLFSRIFRAYVYGSGTYATASSPSHAAEIVIENSAGTEDWVKIDAATFPIGQSEIGAYSIPAGKVGYIKLQNVTIDSGKTIDLIFFSRTDADQSSPPYSAMRAQSVLVGISGGSVGSLGNSDATLGPYSGPADVGFMAKVSTGTAEVSVEFDIILKDI